MKKLNTTAFALAAGITWGLAVFFLALLAMWWGVGQEWVDLLGNVYIGVKGSWGGAFMGLLWGFVDLFIGALIFVLLYNFFAKKFK